MGTSASFYTQLTNERVHVDPRPKFSEEMAEDRRTGEPVLSATSSYVEYIPEADSPVRRSSETFSPAKLEMATLWPKKVA